MSEIFKSRLSRRDLLKLSGTLALASAGTMLVGCEISRTQDIDKFKAGPVSLKGMQPIPQEFAAKDGGEIVEAEIFARLGIPDNGRSLIGPSPWIRETRLTLSSEDVTFTIERQKLFRERSEEIYAFYSDNKSHNFYRISIKNSDDKIISGETATEEQLKEIKANYKINLINLFNDLIRKGATVSYSYTQVVRQKSKEQPANNKGT